MSDIEEIYQKDKENHIDRVDNKDHLTSIFVLLTIDTR